MTYDTDEYTNPYKINIQLEEEEDDSNRKEVFEKGLDALLDDEHFLLLYVPKEEGVKMQIIRPATNLFHRKCMVKRINEAKHIPSFYYALSHLWGLSEDNRYHWNDIKEYVDDEDGQPVKPVSMRPEKRDTLLRLLRDHPDSYWWIDVLCARTDTPLDIMGDIYACCLECIAMIDCEPTLIPQLRVLRSVTKKVEELYRTAGGNPVTRKQIYETKGPQLLDLLDTFFQRRWWQRVWTWQEMALPMGDVRFMAEADTHHQPQTNSTITLNELLGFSTMVCLMRSHVVHGDVSAMKSVARTVDSSLYEISHARSSNLLRISGSKDRFDSLIFSLMSSSRRCYDPADYVYGVLGMMQIKIPRKTDANEVWMHLLHELGNHGELYMLGFRCIGREHEIDLRKAKTIGEVYSKLFQVYHAF